MNDFIETFPGPGSYFPERVTITKSQIAHHIGPKIEKSEDKDKRPGPGKYNPGFTLTTRRIPVLSFGMVQEHMGARVQPDLGPGQYDVNWKTTCRSAPSYAIQPRMPFQTPVTIGPGPGKYDPQGMNKRIYTSFNKSGHEQQIFKNENPAPNQYLNDRQKLSNKKPSFSFRARRYKEQINANPGPGAYDKIMIQKDAGMFTMGGRCKRGYFMK